MPKATSVRCNMTLAVLAHGQEELDLMLQGDMAFASMDVIHRVIIDTVRELSGSDWVTFTVLPIQAGTGWFTPIHWAGFRPTQAAMLKMGLTCLSRSDHGQRCTLGAAHKESEGDRTGGIYHVSSTGDIWE